MEVKVLLLPTFVGKIFRINIICGSGKEIR